MQLSTECANLHGDKILETKRANFRVFYNKAAAGIVKVPAVAHLNKKSFIGAF